MIIQYLQHSPSRRGVSQDNIFSGTTVIGEGSFFDKLECNGRESRLFIEDPVALDGNVGEKSWKYIQIKQAFKIGFQRIDSQALALSRLLGSVKTEHFECGIEDI
ncbi:hypothetical protein GYMLUDRAFT_259565 [Collybiopsis luxurians FD-317 M1]|uniref:Uncharacterized protein n=1 Tax=Collybiopsis luxurians FD-317 M1 TaxID=944289 RepID=A0A0D0CK71_9AGAR|nr:hypothetical protein GYMLUDRAFT_259565 [Collybiopsis luxurians FD-317 M1]